MDKYLVTQRRRVTYLEYRTVVVTCASATEVTKNADWNLVEPWVVISSETAKLPDHVFAIDPQLDYAIAD